jgi:hypothetical protein
VNGFGGEQCLLDWREERAAFENLGPQQQVEAEGQQ